MLISAKGKCTVSSTSDSTLWTLYRYYFKGISANIELQVLSMTCCCPYLKFVKNIIIYNKRTMRKNAERCNFPFVCTATISSHCLLYEFK
jgi:hypothetical protein